MNSKNMEATSMLHLPSVAVSSGAKNENEWNIKFKEKSKW